MMIKFVEVEAAVENNAGWLVGWSIGEFDQIGRWLWVLPEIDQKISNFNFLFRMENGKINNNNNNKGERSSWQPSHTCNT